MDFAQAVHDRRSALGWTTAEPARRAALPEEDIEESGVDPTLELIERLATILEAGARTGPRASPEFRFEEHAARFTAAPRTSDPENGAGPFSGSLGCCWCDRGQTVTPLARRNFAGSRAEP